MFLFLRTTERLYHLRGRSDFLSESDDLVENLAFVIFNHAAVVNECSDPETLIFAKPPLEKNLSFVS
jgi:hypothetical protein